jgi:hypothetical protein
MQGGVPGQLESEVKQKAGLCRRPNRSLLKLDRLPNLWFDIYERWDRGTKCFAAAPGRSFAQLIDKRRVTSD